MSIVVSIKGLKGNTQVKIKWGANWIEFTPKELKDQDRVKRQDKIVPYNPVLSAFNEDLDSYDVEYQTRTRDHPDFSIEVKK